MTRKYDNNGNPEPPKYSNVEFSPVYTSTFFLDNKGRIIKEETTTEKGVIVCIQITAYDNKGRILKTVHRYVDKHFSRADEEPGITHIFEYR